MQLHIRTPKEEIVGFIPPPAGTTTNFLNPPSIKHVIVTINIVFTLLSLVFVILRLYTTRFITSGMGLEDFTVVLAWLCALASSIATSLATRYGLGLHMWDIPISTLLPKFWISGVITAVLYNFSIMFSKFSILAFYLRFCRFRRLRILIYVLIIIIAIYSILSSFEFLWACRPIAKYWDPRIIHGSCIKKEAVPVFQGVMNTVTDFIILILPVFLFWTLRLPRRQKVGVVLIFMTGGFVLSVSIVRLKLNLQLLHMVDFSWEGTVTVAWWMVEVHVAVICTCLPVAKPFLRRHFPKVIGSTLRTATGVQTITTSPRVPKPLLGEGDEVLLNEFVPSAPPGSQRSVSSSNLEPV